jgi:hypothetical protein
MVAVAQNQLLCKKAAALSFRHSNSIRHEKHSFPPAWGMNAELSNLNIS